LYIVIAKNYSCDQKPGPGDLIDLMGRAP